MSNRVYTLAVIALLIGNGVGAMRIVERSRQVQAKSLNINRLLSTGERIHQPVVVLLGQLTDESVAHTLDLVKPYRTNHSVQLAALKEGGAEHFSGQVMSLSVARNTLIDSLKLQPASDWALFDSSGEYFGQGMLEMGGLGARLNKSLGLPFVLSEKEILSGVSTTISALEGNTTTMTAGRKRTWVLFVNWVSSACPVMDALEQWAALAATGEEAVVVVPGDWSAERLSAFRRNNSKGLAIHVADQATTNWWQGIKEFYGNGSSTGFGVLMQNGTLRADELGIRLVAQER